MVGDLKLPLKRDSQIRPIDPEYDLDLELPPLLLPSPLMVSSALSEVKSSSTPGGLSLNGNVPLVYMYLELGFALLQVECPS